jgi:hypothetical protein
MVTVAVIAAVGAGVWWWRKPPALDFADAEGQLRSVRVDTSFALDDERGSGYEDSWHKELAGVRAFYTGKRHGHNGLVEVSWTAPIDRDDPASVETACAALNTSMTRTVTALEASVQGGTNVLDVCRKAARPQDYITDSFAFAATKSRDAGGRLAYTRLEAGQYLAGSQARLVFTVTVDQMLDADALPDPA